jgi:hypothetical protein
MGTVYRFSTPDDEAQIIDMLRRAWAGRPTTDHFLQPELVRWKFWEPCAGWPENRSWVVERDGRIVAHAAIWPVLTVRTGEKTDTGISMLDWGSEPNSAGAGVPLLKRLLQPYDFGLCVGGSAMTQAILPRIGFSAIGEAVNWTRPLRPLKRLMQNPSLDGARGLPGKIVWAQRPSKSVDRRWTCVEFDSTSSELPVPQGPHPQSFFDYLDRCPIGRCFRFHILDEGRKVGWFALFAGRLQARLAGVWLAEPTAENWRVAFNLAQTAALKRTDAVEFLARSASPAAAAGAAQAGMHVKDRERVLLGPKGRTELPALDYQLCDNDDVIVNLV